MFSIDYLYSYNAINDEAIDPTDRYLLSFINDDDHLVEVEFEVITTPGGTQLIKMSEGVEWLTDEELHQAYYLLDRWSINNLI